MSPQELFIAMAAVGITVATTSLTILLQGIAGISNDTRQNNKLAIIWGAILFIMALVPLGYAAYIYGGIIGMALYLSIPIIALILALIYFLKDRGATRPHANPRIAITPEITNHNKVDITIDSTAHKPTTITINIT